MSGSELQHPVLDIGSDGHFRCLTPLRARAESISDHPLVSANRRFDQGAPIVPAPLLPAHAAVISDLLKMPISLRRAVFAVLLGTAVERGGPMTAASG